MDLCAEQRAQQDILGEAGLPDRRSTFVRHEELLIDAKAGMESVLQALEACNVSLEDLHGGRSIREP